MLIRDLTIENFRKFRGVVRLGGFTDGLNLVCEPNETGKSTILEALRAAFFERHGAKSERIKSFRPHGDEVAPTVELNFEAGGGAWTLRKKFLQSPSVSLAGVAQSFQSDAAEEKLQSLLGFARAGNKGADDNSRGALGLLWVEQGQSFHAVAPGDTARRTLEELLAGEVGAVTGGKRTSAVIQSVEKALAQLLTKTGRPTGVLQEALMQAMAADANLATASAELERFEQLLQQLDARRGELRRVERDLDDGEHHALMAQLRTDYDRARLAAEQLNSATLKEQSARGERERAADRTTRRRADRKALATAETSFATAAGASADALAELQTAKVAEAELATLVVAARAALDEADKVYAAAIEARLAADKTRALTAAFARLDRATKLDEHLSKLEDELRRNLMDEAAMAQIEALDRRLLKAQTVVAPGVTHLDVRLDTDAPAVKLNGMSLAADGRIKLGGPTELLVAGTGRFIITPPVHTEAAAAADLKAAEEDLATSLGRHGQPDVSMARLAARRRGDILAELKSGRARLQGECPADPALGLAAGLAPLRDALSLLERPGLEETDSDALQAQAVSAEKAQQDARATEQAAVGRRDEAVVSLRKLEITATTLAAEAKAAGTQRDRLAQDLAVSEAEADDAALEEATAACRGAEALASAELVSARRAAEGLEAAEIDRRIKTAEKKRQALVDARLELARVIAGLEEQAKTQGGVGPSARAAAAKEEAEAARALADRLEEEGAILSLLKQTIEAAQLDAARRYLAPVTKRIEPYITRLLPNAAIAFDETFAPLMLTRSGREERTFDLSKGTQEQIAVLSRLAFADLMIAKGKPASLILDDALVFSDDDRFETMMSILTEASKRMQVIILTCRASAFRYLDANRLSLSA